MTTEGKAHNWVSHTISEVDVNVIDITDGEGNVVNKHLNITFRPGGRGETVNGCDDCGLPLDIQTFYEPCLSELQDELESSMEAGD